MAATDIYNAVNTTLADPASGTGTFLFSMALLRAGLSDLYSNASLNVTVFAPSNGAFLTALAQLGLNQNALEQNAAKMAPILLYHAIQPAATSANLIAAGVKAYPGGFAPYQAVSTSRVDPTGPTIKLTSIGTDANIIIANTTAGNSVVHVIDTLLLPFYPSAAAALSRNPSTSALTTLAGAYAPGVLALLNPLAEFTVFAPINSGFTTALSNGSALLAQLKSFAFGATYLLNYHIVPKPVLFKPSNLTGTTTLTTLTGHKISIVRSGGSTFVVFPGGNATIVGLSFSVGFNSDGSQRAAVHQIDQVLIPPTMNTITDALTVKADATVLLQALTASSSYATAVNNSTFKGTILAPTDAAFNTFLSSKTWTAATLLGSAKGLKQLLDLHVIAGVSLKLSTIANGTTTLNTNSGTGTLSVTKLANGTVTFKSTSTNVTANALGFEYYSGATVGNTTNVIFIDAVLLPETLDVGGGGAATQAGPSPLAMLICSLCAAALLQLFGRH